MGGTTAESYVACVRRLRGEVNPFGPVPRTMEARVESAVTAAGTFVRALNAGVEVINVTEHVAVSRDCALVLLRVQYCAHCRGLTLIKPCGGLCLNALRACLAGVPPLDPHFREFVAGIARLGSRLLAPPSDIQHTLLGTRDLIAGALLHARVHAQRILAMVAQSCGPPPAVGAGGLDQDKDLTSLDAEQTRPPITNARFSDLPLWLDRPKKPRSLRNLLLEFRKSLPVYEGFYATLPQRLCETQFAAPDGSLCWDGNEVVESYQRPVVGTSLEEQQRNPELRVRSVEPGVTLIAHKLQQLNQMLRAGGSGVTGGVTGAGRPPIQSSEGGLAVAGGRGEGGGEGGGSGDCDDEDGCAGSGSGGEGSQHGGRHGSRGGLAPPPVTSAPAVRQRAGDTGVQPNTVNSRKGNSAPPDDHLRPLLATSVAMVTVVAFNWLL